MAKRKTRAELREAYCDLLDIWTHVRVAKIEILKAEGFEEDGALPTAAELLVTFDEKKAPASTLVAALKRALEEMTVGIASGLTHKEAITDLFLAAYHRSSGRCFLDDMGDPARRIKAILRRPVLRNIEEFYMIKTLLDDNLDMLTETQAKRATDLLGAYEKNGAP